MTTTQSTRPQANSSAQDGSIDGSTAPQPGEATRAPERDDGDLSLDLLFEALKNSRRRQVLRYLQAADDATTVSDLAEHVAALENDTTVTQLSSQQRKRVYVGLYQCHLPKLDDIDVVEYDDDRGTVALGPNAAQLTRYVDVAEEDTGPTGRPWHRYYLGVSGVGVLAVGATALGVGDAVSTAAVGVALVLSVLVMAVVHGQESA